MSEELLRQMGFRPDGDRWWLIHHGDLSVRYDPKGRMASVKIEDRRREFHSVSSVIDLIVCVWNTALTAGRQDAVDRLISMLRLEMGNCVHGSFP